MSSKCPRCSKTAYEAECTKVGQNRFHTGCFTCASCKNTLNLNNYTPNKDSGDVYCSGCFAAEFGPAGFRGGTTSTIGFHKQAGAPQGASATVSAPSSSSSSSSTSPKGGKFCGGCGAKREGTTNFCAACGGKFN